MGVCETNANVRSQVASRYPFEGVFESLDQALQHPWDAAVIATPAPYHVPIAQKLAALQIHLLIEKPLSLNEEGLSELQETIARQKLVTCVAYVSRANPAAAAMHHAMASGRFGEPVELVVQAGQNFPHFRPAYREIYYNRRQTGGGAVQDALTHLLNLSEWFIGPANRVLARARHLVLPGVEVEDTVHVLAEHASVPATYVFNQHQFPNESTITLICRRATVRFELHESRWRFVTEPCGKWQDEAFSLPERDDVFIRQATAFLDALEGKAPVLCTLAEGWQTMLAQNQILASSDGGGVWKDVPQVRAI